jgi:transposase
MIQIPAVIERCAGIDVGKREVAVAIITGPADEEGTLQTRMFGTTVPALEKLREWLVEERCTSVAMESTGSYWIPVKNILETSVKIVLICARKQKPQRGDKTDFRDAGNLAHLHRHGLLKGSYLPSRAVVELRDLTRRRKKLLGNLAAEKNRIQKVLEVANVKIGNIISDVFGVSGQAMVSVLVAGQKISIEEIADLSKARLRKRIPELTEALDRHQMNDHHRWLIQQGVEHAVLLDRQLEELEARIEKNLEPYRAQYELLKTIPGVKDMTAASILSEIGPDMSPFETAKKLSAWAGISPGNNRSAGKQKSSRIKKGNKFLLAALVQAAWAAARKRDSIFQRKFHRWVKRLGEAKANVAIAHSLLQVVYALLKQGRPYQEPDPQQMHALEKTKLARHHASRLRKLGADETLVAQLLTQLNRVSVCSASSPKPAALDSSGSTVPERIRKTTPAKVRRGALGVRARQTRSQEYTVLKEKKTRPSPKRKPSKPKPPNTTKNKTAHSSARAAKKTPSPTGSTPADEG